MSSEQICDEPKVDGLIDLANAIMRTQHEAHKMLETIVGPQPMTASEYAEEKLQGQLEELQVLLLRALRGANDINLSIGRIADAL